MEPICFVHKSPRTGTMEISQDDTFQRAIYQSTVRDQTGTIIYTFIIPVLYVFLFSSSIIHTFSYPQNFPREDRQGPQRYIHLIYYWTFYFVYRFVLDSVLDRSWEDIYSRDYTVILIKLLKFGHEHRANRVFLIYEPVKTDVSVMLTL